MSADTPKLGQALSPRQKEILEHLIVGGRRKDIANGMSQSSWGAQVQRLKVKLGAKTMTHAAVLYALAKESAFRKL